MKKKIESDYRTATIDFYAILFMVFIVVSYVAIMAVKPNAEETAGIKKNAQFLITAEWDAKVDCDVDLWIRDPKNKVVSFKFKETGLIYLERDDMGLRNDFDPLSVSDVELIPENKEYATVRGIMEGEYIVNVHLYSCKEIGKSIGLSANTIVNMPVTIQIIKLNPTFSIYKSVDLVLEKVFQEKTAIRFTVNDRGHIIRDTDGYIPILSQVFVP